ncbi:MCE family protein [Mycobacteroides chelonae]|uniref:MCE family protein n=1 Tax=Mycobacteroides chelonae TaxID=1774 RepID=UPI0008A98FD8|nr:MCE family protein [Mycobacteroides chelonae]OHU32940.1 mammalian cell entry protein [Mycobacteroides chelonae]
MKHRNPRRWAGIALIAAIATAIAAIGWFAGGRAGRAITVTAQFPSVSGLYVDNSVSVLGMPVGKVTKITPRGGYADVEFTVDPGVNIPADAQAVTVSTSILTDRHIELTPPYRTGPTLKDGDTIDLARTKTPVEFDRVLGMMDKLSTSLSGDRKGGGPIADVLTAGAEVADGNGEQIKAALDELSTALRQTSTDGGALTREQLTTIITNTSSLFDAAARNDSTLREFGSSIRGLSQIVAEENFGSGTTGHQLNTVIEHAAQILEKNRGPLKESILNGNTITQTLSDRQRELSETFDILPLMLDNLYNAIDQTNGSIRAHFLFDKVLTESQMAKEMCNLLGLRQLGCSTGTLQDYGPDFGLTYILDGMAAMGQK